MSRSGFDFKEYEKWVKDFNIPKSEFEIFLKQFLLEMAQRVIVKTKKRTPVDTGYLRNSWAIGSQNIVQKEIEATNKETGHHLSVIDTSKSDIDSIEVVGDTMQVTISSNVEYASFQEFGYTLRNGTWKQGHFMLTLSVDEIQKQIPKRFEKEFIEFMKSKGVG